ncbi:hypothetical protein [Flagellimonas algicola]|uniref:DUF1579 domain-containing protein n=1 Tax=Flagellimonas algicola TaxID=2583815 RepID=A0ABY2WGX0_9FLAO|nr:hypothetical protein [Allomuricauda algicola]TMU50684.1 hypothetical protein FGG15_17945 [Allomuricauda algicola]
MVLMFLIVFSSSFAQEPPSILLIRENFKTWQPLIDNEIKVCKRFYNYSWGENYQFSQWFDNQRQADTLVLSKMSLIIEEEDLGYFLRTDSYSFSGDWNVTVDAYFDTKGRLYFIFWRMNSFQAEEPVTVEKRLYFDKGGEKIRHLVSVYKMNTKEETDVSYMDIDIDYKLELEKYEVYGKWNSKKR